MADSPAITRPLKVKIARNLRRRHQTVVRRIQRENSRTTEKWRHKTPPTLVEHIRRRRNEETYSNRVGIEVRQDFSAATMSEIKKLEDPDAFLKELGSWISRSTPGYEVTVHHSTSNSDTHEEQDTLWYKATKQPRLF